MTRLADIARRVRAWIDARRRLDSTTASPEFARACARAGEQVRRRSAAVKAAATTVAATAGAAAQSHQ